MSKKKTGRPALEVFQEAMDNIMHQAGGQELLCRQCDLQSVMEFVTAREQTLGLRWITKKYSRREKRDTMRRDSQRDPPDALNFGVGGSCKA